MNRVSWNISGIKTQKEAESRLDDMLDWFRKSFKQDDWTVNTSISNSAIGWRVEVVGEEEMRNAET